MNAHNFNLTTWKAKSGDLVRDQPDLHKVSRQPGLHKETLYQKLKTKILSDIPLLFFCIYYWQFVNYYKVFIYPIKFQR